MTNQKMFAPTQSFEEYQERFKDFFAITRKDGVVEVRMHENGGPTPWKREHNYGWGPVIKAIGDDPENEVLILGGTGDVWAKDMLSDGYAEKVFQMQREQPGLYNQLCFDTFQRVSKMIYSLLYDVDIPTIGVVNGPGPAHMELAFLCDINLCAPNVEFKAVHFPLGMVPGDGFFMIMQYLLGTTRANYLAYTGKAFSAQEAQEWGMVNEIVTSEEIYARAWELAEEIMKQPRPVRRLTHDIMRKPLRDYVNATYNYQAMVEAFGGSAVVGLT